MKESHREGVANHPDPESCAGDGNISSEALTGPHTGQLLSFESTSSACRPYWLAGDFIESHDPRQEPYEGKTITYGSDQRAARKGRSYRDAWHPCRITFFAMLGSTRAGPHRTTTGQLSSGFPSILSGDAIFRRAVPVLFQPTGPGAHWQQTEDAPKGVGRLAV